MTTELSVEMAAGRRRRGFTLVELMIALSLGLMIAVAMMSSLIFMTGSSLSVRNYIDMNSESRKALEIMARDLRNAVDVEEGFSPTEFQVRVLQPDDSLELVTFSYRINGQERKLVRTVGNKTSTLVRDVGSLQFRYHNLLGREVKDFSLSVTQVQIQMTTARKQRGIDNTDRIISARFIMRNKYVTN